jgi:RimJ/RimL family protein N-acetyltransferase
MSELGLRAVYLSGRRVYLRAMVKEDAERGAAWLDDAFPVNAGRAEKVLEEDAGMPWPATRRRMVIVRTDGDEVVGGAIVSSYDQYRTGWLHLTMAPWLPDADSLRAEALRLLVPFLRDESEMMAVTLALPADQADTIAAAGAAGMVTAARLREWFVRPGGRADCLLFEALNARWEVRDA